jgi:hypothetical protein
MGLGLWMAVVIAILTAVPRRAYAPRVLVAGAASALVASTMLVAVDGVWDRPYRASNHADSTHTAADVPALSSVTLDPTTARDYAALRARLEPYLRSPGRAMMAFDGLPGLVLMLGGRPVGEAWYAGGAPERTSAAILRTCEDGHPWWRGRKPVVMFSRIVTDRDRQTLEACGLSLTDDYRAFTVLVNSVFYDRRLPLRVYVPRDEVPQ